MNIIVESEAVLTRERSLILAVSKRLAGTTRPNWMHMFVMTIRVCDNSLIWKECSPTFVKFSKVRRPLSEYVEVNILL